VEEAAGRAPVVAHIGEVSTRETRRLGQQIARLGLTRYRPLPRGSCP
jgi:4-hydroxy-tetrahydrodipicolinate synthase